MKHKAISFINIIGFAVGIAACLTIALYVHNEFTYDSFNSKSDRIVRITTTMRSSEGDLRLATSPALLADVLTREFQEVESVVRLEVVPTAVRYGNDLFNEASFYKTEQSLFEVFTFNFIEGSPEVALVKPNSIVITESIARKYFGSTSAVGKVLHCDGEDLTVMAVVEDRPSNSDIRADAFLYADFSNITRWSEDMSAFTFILFDTQPDFQSFSEKLAAIDAKYIQPEFRSLDAYYTALFELEPLREVHFSKNKIGDTPKGDKVTNYTFSLLAIFILAIALMNYITLAIARAIERAKEVGIRKVNGAGRSQLVWQFLFESTFIVLLSWLIAVTIVYFSLPYINDLLQTNLVLNTAAALVTMVVTCFATLILASIYPAMVLSGYRPINVLKGSFKHSDKGVIFRKVITVVQFGIVGGLVLCTTVVYRQMEFIQNKDLGLNKEQLLTIFLPDDSLSRGRVTAFQNALRQQPQVSDVTVSSRLSELGVGRAPATIDVDGVEKQFPSSFFQVDEHYVNVFQIQLKEGRNFSSSLTTDKTEAVLVNEAFVKMAGWKSAVGQDLAGFDRKAKVIGVVKNFYYKSLHSMIEPLVLLYNNNPQVNTTTAKIIGSELGVIKELYSAYFPERVFDYQFLDNIIDEYYRQEHLTFNLFNKFTVLTMLIACMGLYGLVSLIAVQRSKEVCLRKILGASTSELFMLVSRDLIVLVFVALIISLPIASVVINNWLSSYAYHISLSWWLYLIPVLIVMVTTLAVISKEILKVAMIQPIEQLRVD